MKTRLQDLNPRFLNLLAAIFSDREATVTVSARLAQGTTVAFDRWQLFLNPETSGLRDLCVAARVLRFRQEARAAHEAGANPEKFPARQARRWIRAAFASLQSDFPQVLGLSGRFDPHSPRTWPQLAWQQIAMRPLEDFPSDTPIRSLQMESIRGVEFTGAGDDFAWLWQALREGKLPLEDYLPLREMSVLKVPLQLSVSTPPGRRFRDYEERVAEIVEEGLVNQFAECYRRKASAENPQTFQGAPRSSGLHLDTRRLADVALALRTGLPPRIFRKRTHSFQPVFDPRRHLAVLAFDTSNLLHSSLRSPRFSHRALALFLRTYEELDIDVVVVGFSDHIAEFESNGRKQSVYLHCPTVLKAADESFGASFINKLTTMLESPPQIQDAEPACFPPLVLRTALEEFRRGLAERPYSYLTLNLILPHAFPARPEFERPDFFSRIADSLDSQLTQFRGEARSVFDTLGCYLSPSIIRHARPGGFVAGMH